MNMHITTALITGLFLSSVAFGEPPVEDLLAGPTIEKEQVSDQDMLNRRLQETGKTRTLNSRQQSRMWLSALHSLNLTETQSIAIRELLQELQSEQQAFNKKYGEELKKIRTEHAASRKDGGIPTNDSRQRMLEIGELSPDVTSYQERAWILLTSEQQTLFQVKYQELIVEDQKQHDERRNKDRPSMDEMPDREFAPKDSQFGDKEAGARGDRDARGDRGERGDIIGRRSDSVNDDSLRRIKFLQRLQRLQEQD